MSSRLLLLIRRFHLYLSVFFSPLLLLFVVTGWAQTTGFLSSNFLMEEMSDVHTGQYFPSIQTKISGPLSFAGQTGTATGSKSREMMTWPMKRLVAVMCVALIISISLGLILAFTVVRNRVPVWIALFLGVAVPVLFLALPHMK